ncbi:hypothetical protein N7468_008464 [Penicillium chermesinum]|uniref:Uncharacterized protein n=1 Tax=Penicillium chermesinum TaxID=63820 RepID=A0A9W9TIC0_9EURO|nr:uncharacterized protein N7468_008464 [Penicillium chermesinum]KAJ5223922.1 hypothetical protein N7468_008464 [Penicillium chermesinum]
MQEEEEDQVGVLEEEEGGELGGKIITIRHYGVSGTSSSAGPPAKCFSWAEGEFHGPVIFWSPSLVVSLIAGLFRISATCGSARRFSGLVQPAWPKYWILYITRYFPVICTYQGLLVYGHDDHDHPRLAHLTALFFVYFLSRSSLLPSEQASRSRRPRVQIPVVNRCQGCPFWSQTAYLAAAIWQEDLKRSGAKLKRESREEFPWDSAPSKSVNI